MAGDRDLLQLLANPTNRSILSVLSMEPQYPRRLAELVGLTEDEASRRLRMFEKIGLAEGSWAHVGKNVRLYQLSTSRFTIQIDAGGVSVSGVHGQTPIQVGPAGEIPPSVERFVGRDAELKELGTLLENRRAVCVQGIGGTGKTALAARHAASSGRPVLWHALSSSESGRLLAGRLASNQRFNDAGDRAQQLVQLRDADDEALLVRALVDSINATRALVVLDRFEAAGEGAVDIVTALARGLAQGRLLITSRAFPAGLGRDLVYPYRLGGLSPTDASQLLRAYGAHPTDDSLDEIYDRTRGHPLCLVLVAQIADDARDARVERLMQEAGIRDFLVNDVVPQLSEPERDVLFALSVFRHPFMADDVEMVSDHRHARHALLKLEGRGLVSRAGDSFLLHDLVRTFLADAAPQKRLLHGRAAKALRASGEPGKVLEAVHHYLEAGAVTEAAEIVREEASRRTYRFFDQGLGPRYRAVLEPLAASEKVDPASRGAADLELGFLDTFVGDANRARAHLEVAARTLESSKRDLAVPLLIATGRLLRVEGKLEDAAKKYQEAEQAAAKANDVAHELEALIDWAFLEEERSDETGFRLYRRAIDLATEASDIRLLSLAYSGAARIGMREGDPQHMAWAQEGLRLARVSGFLRGEVSVYMTLTTYAMMRGEMLTGLEYSDRYLRVATQLGDPWLKACALSDKAMLLIASKMYEEALALGREVLSISQSINSVFYECSARVVLAEALVALEKPREAAETIRPALLLDGKAWTAMVARGWRVLAAAEAVLGRAKEATSARRRAASLEAKKRKGDLTDDIGQLPGPGRRPVEPETKAPRATTRGRKM